MLVDAHKKDNYRVDDIRWKSEMSLDDCELDTC